MQRSVNLCCIEIYAHMQLKKIIRKAVTKIHVLQICVTASSLNVLVFGIQN